MMEIPLFPLNVVLFPGMPLNLHIFEPRYRLMIQTCLEHDRPFGVALIRRGLEALGPPAEPHAVGCSARIVDTERLPDGRMNITVVGEERFRIVEIASSQPYLTGRVELYPMEVYRHPRPLDVLRQARPMQRLVERYLDGMAKFGGDVPDLSGLELPEDVPGKLYMAAALLQIPMVEKQPLLEAPTAGELISGLARIYRREIALLRGVEQMDADRTRRAAWLN